LFLRTHEEILKRNEEIKKEEDMLIALTQIPDITKEELEQIDEFILENYNKYIFL